MILSPAVIRSSVSNETINQIYEKNVQDTLQTFLSTTKPKYSYRTGSTYIDAVAQDLGLNTSNTEGIYAVITNQILGKQQYHKTYAQLITEDLATQYQIIINDTIVFLNPFSIDAHEELTRIINDELNDLLPKKTSFNCSMVWQPIKGISFGGKTFVGEPIPSSVSTYSSHQKLSMPFLPRIKFSNSSFYFSSYHLRQLKDVLINEISSLKNISYSYNQTINITNEQLYNQTYENLSSFLSDFFISGLRSNKSCILYPSILDMVTSYLFSKNSFSYMDHNNSNAFSTSYQRIGSLLDACNINQSAQPVDITNSIISSFGSKLKNQLYGLTFSVANQFLDFIKQTLTDLLQIVLQPLILELTDLVMSSQATLNQLFDSFIDLLSSYLSISEATISLTVWRG
jgi:hypothetical protein